MGARWAVDHPPAPASVRGHEREEHHVADGRRIGHEHRQPIDAESPRPPAGHAHAQGMQEVLVERAEGALLLVAGAGCSVNFAKLDVGVVEFQWAGPISMPAMKRSHRSAK